MEDNGFVVENIGKIRMYDQAWKMLAYLNLTVYKMEMNKVIIMEKQIEDMCDQLINHPADHSTRSCDLVPKQLKFIIQDIKSLSKLLPFKNINKSKRGILNFIGEIQSVLFGTLAASDAEFYDDQINKLSRNQIQSHDLIKQQTSIIKSSLELHEKRFRSPTSTN